MTKLLFTLLAFPAVALADTVTLSTGEAIEGELLDLQASFVMLRLPDTEGEAIRRLGPDRIESLSFSDPQASLESQALKRAKFISLLSLEDARLLPRYLSQLLDAGDALSALSYAKLWHPKNRHPSLDSHYRVTLVRSAAAAGLSDEALVHAQRWLALSPPPVDHPLPWQIQAQHQLEKGDFEAALWTSLTPLAHAQHRSSSDLAALRAIASQAYQNLGYAEHSLAYQSDFPRPTQPFHFDPLHPPQ
ncbi:hypothetical protein IEN85_01895 [Pelagicoccus sp. NFK12]|uniref:Uncharacterized protein n=1 Tax=Pelagicoccus enzymogenes TaxID=2773457 RepID=A0A927IG21_9BACT|nr:hypothetical protein [Pelagicoccus enzymogenes]MBD5778243.1 hypothetical protein [Pelagicoccus enzymogenes]